LRDDFSIWNIELLKVALNPEQISRFQLPPMMQAKAKDSRAAKFTAKHGAAVFELEALPPETLQAELTTAIENAMDLGAFNRELDAEKQDAAFIANLRQRAQVAFKDAA
jgi:hypothetical protein